MARADSTGLDAWSVDRWQRHYEQSLRERLGDDIALDPETPQGQILGISALASAELDEALLALANARSVLHATGQQEDDLFGLLHITRRPATRSTVVLTITGVAGTAVPAGTIFSTQAGSEWRTTVEVLIPAAGSVDVTAEATQTGPVEAATGEISRVIQALPGIEAVTNQSAAVAGRERESDSVFRQRYQRSTGILSSGPVDSVSAALWDVEGVSAVRVEVNDSSTAVTRQGLSIGPHAVMAIVRGGSELDVAEALLRTKSLGCGMSGDTTSGEATFQRVADLPLVIDLEITPSDIFPASGIPLIRERLVEWFDGVFLSRPGRFEVEGIGVGGSLDTRRLLTPVNSVPGHTIRSLGVSLSPAPAAMLAASVSLHTADPGATGEHELEADGYARASATAWGVTTTGDGITNTASVTFPTATGTGGPVTHFAVRSATGGLLGAGEFGTAFNWGPTGDRVLPSGTMETSSLFVPEPPPLHGLYTLADGDISVTIPTDS